MTPGTATLIEPPTDAQIEAFNNGTADAKKPETSDTRWEDWHIGCLLDMAITGKSYTDIGATLKRTHGACLRMFNRLLDGDAPCPTHYAEALATAREKFTPLPAAHKATIAAIDPVVAAKITTVETMLQCILAVCILDGQTTIDEVQQICGSSTAAAVAAMVDALQITRKAAEAQTAANHVPAPAQPADAELEAQAQTQALNNPDPFETP
jgi:hypothetical protein